MPSQETVQDEPLPLARAIVRAEKKVRGALRERPAPVEQMASRLASARALWSLAAAAIAWVAVNQWLHARGLPSADPFPFQWLQRAAIVACVIALVICARASSARRERAWRREAAQRELFDAIAAEAASERTKH